MSDHISCLNIVSNFFLQMEIIFLIIYCIHTDTVNYEKDYFHLEKKVGDYVQAGDVIGHFDLKTLIYDECNVKTPVVIPTQKDKIKINLLKEGPIDLETEIMEIVF